MNVDAILQLCDRWDGMRKRCARSSYAKRGIAVAQNWRGAAGRKRFVIWSLKNGYHPRLELDRRNNARGYGPRNCRWVTRSQNGRNTSVSLMVRYRGRIINVQTLSERPECVVSYHCLKSRIHSGWSVREAVSRPSNHGNAWARGTRR
jgi:hypothetical protein